MTYPVCFDCADKYGRLTTDPIGVWAAPCAICGETRICADSWRDFRITDERMDEIRQDR